MSRAAKTTPPPKTGSGGLPWLGIGLAVLIAAAVVAAVLFRPGNRTESPRDQAEAGDTEPTEPRQRIVDPEVYALLEQVQTHLQTRRFEDGLAAVDEFLANHSEDAGAFYARGLLHLGKLNYQAAIDALERAVELDPGHPDAYFKLGTGYSRIGALDDANRALETALELRPGFAEAALLLGQNLARQGDSPAARDHFDASAGELPHHRRVADVARHHRPEALRPCCR